MDIFENNFKWRHYLPKNFSYPYKRKIGIMGGSFDPIHEGHLHITETAKILAGLDEVWWIVSQKNPLKLRVPKDNFEKRVNLARSFAKFKWIKVLDIEKKNNFFFTYQTLLFLKKRMKNTSLYWIMGADNLNHLSKWKNFKIVKKTTNILVMNRPAYNLQIFSCQNLNLLNRKKRKRNPRSLLKKSSYFWSIIYKTRKNISSTKIRNKILNAKLAELL